ncbi:hypothetical protein MYVA_3210 [Mycolicibacterium vaccae 95051]|nr:hypothetical protein MYVA_3210 [Mycolicibacterium vaccae 95051]
MWIPFNSPGIDSTIWNKLSLDRTLRVHFPARTLNSTMWNSASPSS